MTNSVHTSVSNWKRLLIWFGGLALAVLLGARLVELQAWHGDAYRFQADDNRFYTLELSADRGPILDRYGQPLAYNTKRYFRVTDPDSLYGQRVPINRAEALALMATDSAQVATQNQRVYPYGSALAHVVGYVGRVTAEELEANPAASLAKDYGKYGLEKTWDDQLQGQDGAAVYEINALGQRQRRISEQPASSGQALQTTLDPILSQVAYQALGDQRGVVIVGDAETGEVLSLISKPAFDPNQLSQQFLDESQEQDRVQYVRSLFSDELQPMFNRAISGVYPPGSVFKVVTALAGLETGALDPFVTVNDEGVLRVGEYEYRNWFFRQYGRVDGEISLARAIARSNDIYFYKAAEWIGPSDLADFSRRMGFGQAIDIGLYPVAKGIVPDPAWKQATFGERWYLGNTYHFGIGQGDMLVSPLQVWQLAATVGHAGQICPPRLVSDQTGECTQLGISDSSLETVVSGLIDACSPGGTAFPFFQRNQAVLDGFPDESPATYDLLQAGAVACKTGTAEFGGLDEFGYRRTHGWLIAVVEPNLPDIPEVVEEVSEVENQPDHQAWLQQVKEHGFPERLAFTVLVESDDDNHYKEGSRDAGPVVDQILSWIEGDELPEPSVATDSAQSP